MFQTTNQLLSNISQHCMVIIPADADDLSQHPNLPQCLLFGLFGLFGRTVFGRLVVRHGCLRRPWKEQNGIAKKEGIRVA